MRKCRLACDGSSTRQRGVYASGRLDTIRKAFPRVAAIMMGTYCPAYLPACPRGPAMRIGFWCSLFLSLLAPPFLSAAEPVLIRSLKNGAWSAADTWEGGRVPPA